MPPTFALLFPFLIALAGCDLLRQDDPDTPLPPGRRDYVWKVDTLSTPPGGFIYDIWGSSPNDVWAVVEGGFPRLWHYDGEDWEAWPEFFSSSFLSIFGFSTDNVWMGGGDGQIHHYDGNKWTLNHTYQVDGMLGAKIRAIWGTSASNIYAIGSVSDEQYNTRSFILNYNGTTWRELLLTDFYVLFESIRRDGKGLFLQGIKLAQNIGDAHTKHFYRVSNGQLIEIRTQPESQSRMFMENIGKVSYFQFNQKLHTYSDGQFNLHLDIPFSSIYGFGGRHEKDVFFFNQTNVFHFDGETTIPLTSIGQLPRGVSKPLYLEKDVFFIVLDMNSSIIYHGNLK